MKNIIGIMTLATLLSCGPDVTKKYYLNDEDINSKLADHEERITLLEQLPYRLKSLEDEVFELERSMVARFDAVNDLISALDAKMSKLSNKELKLVKKAITDLRRDLSELDRESMEILPICNSREHVIRSKGELFAVISSVESVNITFKDCFNNSEKNCNDRTQEIDQVINVHLGKLTQGNYRLTDGSNITFSVNNNEIINCKGEL